MCTRDKWDCPRSVAAKLAKLCHRAGLHCRARRGCAVALVFIAGRFVLGVTEWEARGVEIVLAIIWSCLALSVVLADVAIHWKEIRSALTVPVRSCVAEGSMPKRAVGAT